MRAGSSRLSGCLAGRLGQRLRAEGGAVMSAACSGQREGRGATENRHGRQENGTAAAPAAVAPAAPAAAGPPPPPPTSQ